MTSRSTPGDRRERLIANLQRAWSGRGLVSNLLLPLAWLFGVTVETRRWLYRRGHLASHALPVPVVVVGNLLAGGAGKTPTVIAIVQLLRQQGWTPGIVSRGHGREREAELHRVEASSDARLAGDEPVVLARRTGAPVVVGSDRVAACHALLQAEPTVDVIVSDDGLQHLAMHRDVEVIVFDERGLGNGRLLPAGPLREPPRAPPAEPPGPTRLVLYNAGAPSTSWPGFLGHRKLGAIASLVDWWHARPTSAAALDGLRSRPSLAAAGLARPGRFFEMLREAGFRIDEMPLPDHYDFATLPWPSTAGDVIVTEKDAVKLIADRRLGVRVWVAALDFEPEATFAVALSSCLPARHTTLPDADANAPA